LSEPSGFIAYRCQSDDPTYIVPSLPIAGLDLIPEPVSYLHLSEPSGFIA